MVSLRTHFNTMKQALAKCPHVNLQIIEESVPSMLDSQQCSRPDAPELF